MTAIDFKLGARLRKRAYANTPLLDFLAGEHAQNVAAVWSAPHEGFLTLPAARRHSAAMLLAGLGVDPVIRMTDIRHLVERERDKLVARALVGDDYGAGLMKALAKAGETLWSREDMANFLDLFRDVGANRVIRHMEEITPVMFVPMVELTPVLRDAAIVRNVAGKMAAKDLSLALALVERIRGKGAVPIAVQRWKRAENPQILFTKAAEDLIPDRPRIWEQPPELPAIFEPVESVKALKAAALEFKNCLADFAFDIGKGRMAVYLWRGEPNAAVALTWNVDGWRLAEAEAANNEPLDDAPLKLIIDAVEKCGVRAGPAVETMQHRLQEHGRRGFAQEGICHPHHSLGEAIDLGDLWR